MAQNITIAGASFTDVPSIVVPKTSSGTATYMDTSDATASASDIDNGKTAYVNGSLISGTSTISADYASAETALGSSGVDLDDAINALTTYANETTGASDTDLSSAVASLVAGYGGGGADVYFGSQGTMYTVNFESDATEQKAGLVGCEYLESIYAPNATSTNANAGGYNCTNLKSVHFPKCTTFPNYFIRQQGSTYCNLETVTIGSVGYPVTNLTSKRWRYGSHASTLTVTIFVDATALADIPTAVSSYAVGDNAYAPSGSTVTVIYKNSSTGETIAS